jgi:ubiquinone/menaquinone biosynthesis C-methylase UbiE
MDERTEANTMRLKRRMVRRLFSAAAIALALFAPAAPARAQEDWAKRDAWQRPDEVLDALKLKAGSAVADVGAGNGYFTFHLAHRVGTQGKAFAVDLRSDVLQEVRDRAAKEKLTQIETVQGTASDPKLAAESLDAILVMNAYHEFVEHDAMMQAMLRALKPGGLLAIIDAQSDGTEARESYEGRHTLPKHFVLEDAERNGFHLVRELPGFKNPERGRTYYFLLFEKTTTNK